MTAVIGLDIGTETAAGERTGLGQSPSAAAGSGKALTTNWLRPVSGNVAAGSAAGLAPGLASEAPSFRSSWQSQVSAWRGVSRGTNGVEGQETSDAEVADALSAAPLSRAVNSRPTLQPAQMASAGLSSNGATTNQNALPAEPTGQRQTWLNTNRPAWNAVENSGAPIPSTASAEATATDRPVAANRNRAGSASSPASHKNSASATSLGAQAPVPTMEAPLLVPAIPARLVIPTLVEAAGKNSLPESQTSPSNWQSIEASRSAQLSGSPQLPGAVGIASTAQSHAMQRAAFSSLEDTETPAASQPVSSISSAEVRSAEVGSGPSIAQNVAAKENLSPQTVPTLSTGNSNHPATVENVAPSATDLPTSAGAVQTSPEAVGDAAQQITDRATPRAANRDTTRASAASATQVSAAQPATLDAAASAGLRSQAAPPIAPPTTTHGQTTATANSATTQDRFSALDAGTSPGTPAWTFAGSQHAEAGFRDPALGWVSVRADLNGGGIHATLVPGSADAAQALSGHLAGLSTHLAEQQSPVTSVTMASPSGNGAENGMGQRMQQGAEGNPQRNAPEQTPSSTQGNTSAATSNSALHATTQTGMRDAFAQPGDLRGTHISVMA